MSVAPPGPGLGSNFNYFLTDGGNPITGVNVEITFAEPLISTSNGFGFQLNTYAQELPNAPSTTPNWQQYVVFMQPGDNTLYGIIDNWSGTLPSGVYAQVINDESQIASLPTATEIPAGATINIIPTFDSNNVITGITYIYTPPGGQAVSSSVTLTDLNVFGTNNKITSAYESPIVALTLNIVGDYNGNSGTFSSGSGTIVYSAAQPLTVVTNEPSYTSFGGITGETANTVYGELPESDTNSITQSWSIGQSGRPDVEPAVATLNLPIPPSAKKIQQDQ